MKNKLSIGMTAFFALCGPIFLMAENKHNQKCPCKESYTTLQESVYLEAENIIFADNRILVSIDGITYTTPAINTDENGYYVQKVKRYNCGWYEWECGRCHWCNWKAMDLKCQSCDCPKADCS